MELQEKIMNLYWKYINEAKEFYCRDYKEDPPMYNTDDIRIIQLDAIEENLSNFTQDILDLLNGVRSNV